MSSLSSSNCLILFISKNLLVTVVIHTRPIFMSGLVSLL
jgi:hypothetical protein